MEQVAEVYARSLFEVAHKRDVLARVRDELKQFSTELTTSETLKTFFLSPYFSTSEKTDGLKKVIQDADESTLNFLQLLIEQQRLALLTRIERAFDRHWRKNEQILEVEVQSAVELDKQTTATISERISKQTGKTVELIHNINPELIGGIIIQVGGTILDASIKTRLDRMRHQIA